MGLHKAFDRDFYLVGGAVMTEGGSFDLSRGQIGIFDTTRVTSNGTVAVSNFKGISDDRKLVFEYRRNDGVSGSRSRSGKTDKSFPFSIKDVVELRVHTPKSTEVQADIVILGYNGIDPETSLKFRRGETTTAAVKISGEKVGLLGYPNAEVTVPMYFDAGDISFDDCNPMDPCASVDCVKIVQDAIDRFNEFKLRGGVPVSEFVKASPIRSCVQEEQETPYCFHELNVCDTGDGFALGAVRQQYPGKHIERVARRGSVSTYELLQAADAPAPEDYKITLPSILKGCKACPDGYTATESGFVYSVLIEDDGEDKTSVIEGLANAVAGTGVKSCGQEYGIGMYTVVLSKKLSDADFNAFIEANPTATVDFVSSVSALCKNDSEETVAWVKTKELKLTEREFTIDLPDNDCDGLKDRLEELQAAYPELTIELEGTKGGCQTRYKTCVKTNLRGEVCDPIFLDAYTAEAPAPFEGRFWKPVVAEAAAQEGCLCGIKFEGQVLSVIPPDCIDDKVGYIEDGIKLQVSGGTISEVREGIGKIEDKAYHTEHLQFASKRTHMGYALKNFEKRSKTYFEGILPSKGGKVREWLTGEGSNIDPTAQYVQYSVVVRRDQFAQGMAQKHYSHAVFNIYTPVGTEAEVEKLLNGLAAQAGINGVRAFG